MIVSIIMAALFMILIADKLIMPLYTRHGHELVAPDIRGLMVSDALGLLESRGFSAIVEETRIDPIGKYIEGQIMEQFPSAGTRTKQGRRIYLRVSTGGGRISLPKLTARTQRQALQVLEDLGLVASSEHQWYFNDSGGPPHSKKWKFNETL